MLALPLASARSYGPDGFGDGDTSDIRWTNNYCQNKASEALQIDDVQIHADAHLTRIRLPDVAGGQSLDNGVFDLGVDKDGLTVKGQGSLASVPVAGDH